MTNSNLVSQLHQSASSEGPSYLLAACVLISGIGALGTWKSPNGMATTNFAFRASKADISSCIVQQRSDVDIYSAASLPDCNSCKILHEAVIAVT